MNVGAVVESNYDLSQPGWISRANGGVSTAYFVDDREVAESLWSSLPAVSVDLIDFVLGAYLADRLATANTRGEFGRRIRLTLGMRLHERWDQGLTEEVEKLLAWLSGDAWSLAIVPYAGPRRVSEVGNWLLSSQPPEEVRLFSGGLDSFAGAAIALAAEGAKRTFLISGAPNTHQLGAQRHQCERLRAQFGDGVQHLAVRYGLRGGNRIRQNPWRRTRGLLHLGLGCAAALAAGLKELHLDENGWGALNLPYDDAQLGADMSRAVHPETLLRMSRLVAAYSGAPFRIINHSVLRTKAEMLAAVPEALRGGVALTFSCDRFRLRVPGVAQCGCCTSCLLRRQALAAAALEAYDRQDYRESCPPDGPAVQPILWQAMRLRRCLEASAPWAALVREFPELEAAVRAQAALEGEEPAAVRGGFERLLRQHVREWNRPLPAPLGVAA